jgi:tetratricopeptide (TPR) repeat protein
MSLRPSLAFLAALALVGCNQASADKDPAQTDSPDTNPNYKQAQQDLDNNNPQGAVADYDAALAANPKLAGAHYELGVIYGDKLNDPISSIYHFKRFLDLSPNTDKKDQVQALIDKESEDFAASLPNDKPAITQADMDKLTADNAALKKQVDDANTTIAQLQEKLKTREAVAAASTDVTAPAPSSATTDANSPNPPKALPVDPAEAAKGTADAEAATATPAGAASAAGARSYTVVKGDSYWKIAKKMYPGDTKNGVTKIQEANKQTMGKPLKIGQVLVIP